jgi:hypothetical protein
VTRRYDLVVLGAGTAGIVASTYAAGLGARVALVEQSVPGGDCLFTGCIPSKSLLAEANLAEAMRRADRVGLEPVEPRIDLFDRRRAKPPPTTLITNRTTPAPPRRLGRSVQTRAARSNHRRSRPGGAPPTTAAACGRHEASAVPEASRREPDTVRQSGS